MSIPDVTFWSELAATLLWQTAATVVLAIALTPLVRSGSIRRFIWRTAVVCVLALTVSNLGGIGNRAAALLLSHPVDAKAGESAALGKNVELKTTARSTKITFAETENRNAALWPGMIWLLGCMVIGARVVLAHCWMAAFRRRRKAIVQSLLVEETGRIATRLGMSCPKLIEGTHVAAPFTFGIFRPVIVVPQHFIQRFEPVEREAILTHELAHIAAGDAAWHALADCVTILLWWNPLIWLARRALHDASELAADESVAAIDRGAETLAGCLVKLARDLSTRFAPAGVGMNATERRSNLRHRIERLLNLRGVARSTLRQRIFQMAAAVCFVSVAILAAGWTQRNAVSSDSSPAPLGIIWRTAFADLTQSASKTLQPPRQRNHQPEVIALYSKQFHVEPDAFVRNLKVLGKDVSSNIALNRGLKEWFTELGVDFLNNSKTLFYNDRTGLLLVRATLTDLENIETAVEFLNAGGEGPQLSLTSKIVEIDPALEAVFKSNGLDLSRVETLEPNRFQKLLDTLSKISGADVVSTPKVTILSGRAACVSVANGPGNGEARAGVSVYYAATVQRNGRSINLSALFWLKGNPHDFANATAKANNTIEDGATSMFASPESGGKRHVVFTTVTMIDAFGKPVHKR